jgi:adenylate cyclase class IV
MKTIEIEHRCLINLEQYDKLHEFLLCHSSQDLGEDDKNVFFFILPDKLLKVTHNISKETAKITLKLSKIGVSNDFEEIEIPINPIDIQLAVNIFKKLGFTQIQESFQKRHNFIYQ